MPEYLNPINGVALSQAMAEAYASAPTQRAVLQTLTFTHSAFDSDVHVVADHAPFTAKLENGVTEVTFQPVAVVVDWPEQSDSDAVPALRLSIDGVSQVVLPQLDLALSTIEPVLVTPRVYASDEPDGPAHNVAAVFELTSASVSETRVSCTAAIDDAANVSYPAVTFTRAMYPGLTSR
jgi:hypothetical protein